MARAKRETGEEDSFYDAFLSATNQAPGGSAEAPAATEAAAATAQEGAPRSRRRAPAAPGPTAENIGSNGTASHAADRRDQVTGRRDAPRAETTVAEGPAPAQTRTTTNGRGVGRRSDPAYMQASSYMPRRMRRQVDRALLNDPSERDYSELIEELVREWLAKQGMSA